jgi:hypothetical protein
MLAFPFQPSPSSSPLPPCAFRPMHIDVATGAVTLLEPGVHPCHRELSSLSYEPWQLEVPEPLAPKTLEATPLTLVDTPEALDKMVQELGGSRHIAIDLENHSYRCCVGIVWGVWGMRGGKGGSGW